MWGGEKQHKEPSKRPRAVWLRLKEGLMKAELWWLNSAACPLPLGGGHHPAMALAVFPKQSKEIFSFRHNLGYSKPKLLPKSKEKLSVMLESSVGVWVWSQKIAFLALRAKLVVFVWGLTRKNTSLPYRKEGMPLVELLALCARSPTSPKRGIL